MSTALLYCGTSEGFVIGADGRAFDILKKQVESDTERKIFAFESKAASVVFAWAGTVKTRTLGGDFGLVDQTYDLLPYLDFNSYYALEFNAKLQYRLRRLGTNETGKCAVGIFLSYRKGQSWISEVSVFKNGRTWDCSVEEYLPSGEIDIVSGPEGDFEKPQSLSEANNMIRAYLEDCVSHPTDQIGGQIHIGKFTSDGFSWIQPPK